MKNNNLLQSFKCAMEGILYCLKTQRNMRIHSVVAVVLIFGSLFLKLNRYDYSIIIISASLVIVCEMINTAIEKSIDLFTDKYHPIAKIAKDVSSGAVLISALSSVSIGYLILIDKIIPNTDTLISKIREKDFHIAFFSIFIVVVIVVLFKYFLNSRKIIQGGMPSGHGAVAFSLVMAIYILSKNTLVSILSFFIAILVIQSRVEGKIHSILEVSVGSIAGAAITYVVFRFLT